MLSHPVEAPRQSPKGKCGMKGDKAGMEKCLMGLVKVSLNFGASGSFSSSVRVLLNLSDIYRSLEIKDGSGSDVAVLAVAPS